MSVKVTGLDEFQRRLRELRERAEAIDGEQTISMAELLTPDFLASCSTFSSAEEMFERGGFRVETQEDFAAIPDDAWDEFVRLNTSFFSWKEMLDAAGAAWAKSKLGF